MVFLRWSLVIFYVVALFLFSGRPLSSANTMTQSFLKLFPSLSRANIQALVFYMRKGLHVVGYFLAASIIFRAIKVTPGLKKHSYCYTFLFTLLFAILDEWYQSFLPFRTGSAKDVAIDMIGISLAMIVIRLKVKRQKKAPSY